MIEEITASGFYGIELSQKVNGPGWFVWNLWVSKKDSEGCFQLMHQRPITAATLEATLSHGLFMVRKQTAKARSEFASSVPKWGS